MPPEHGVVSSNLTGRATFQKSAIAKHVIKPSLRLINKALKKVEAKGTYESAGLPIGLRRSSADSKAGCRFLQLSPPRGLSAVCAGYAACACEKARYSSSDRAGRSTQSV